MDLDHHFQEAVEEPLTDQEQLKKSSPGTTDVASDNNTGCFDCNICLDFAQDPVVTLCGHLYCWPCIYKWISHKSASPLCPVCKANLSQATIVPLYGRGDTSSRINCKPNDPLTTPHMEIPQRPSAYRANAFPVTTTHEPHYPQQQHLYEHERHRYGIDGGRSSPGVFRSTLGTYGGTAVQVLPWVFGYPEPSLYYSNPYNQITGSVYSPQLRRQEMQAERSLSRISAFLFCCLVLCLLLF